MTVHSKDHVSKYLRILEFLKEKHANICTQKQLAEMLDVSLRTFSKFYAGNLIDINLLIGYAGMVSYNIKLDIEPMINNQK